MKLSRSSAAFILAAFLSPAFAQTQAPAKGVDFSAIDKTVNPCTDFYRYACGNWIATHPIPPDESVWGRFNELIEQNRVVLRGILEKAAAEKPPANAIDQKIGDFYAACMDDEAVNRKGLSPIQPDLDRIAKIESRDALAAEVAHLDREGIPVLFRFGSAQDAKNSAEMIAQASQGGLSLPDRDYYLKTNPKSVDTRQKFVAHVQRMFELLGHDPAKAAAEAQTVMSIETELAKVSLDRVSLRDPYKTYHRDSIAQLVALSPAFEWHVFMSDMDVSVPTLNVEVPDFFHGMSDAIANHSVDDLKTYLTWHVLHQSAPLLSDKFVNENFAFYGRTLTGEKELQPRWKRCVAMVDRNLGEALGQRYVEQTFGEQGKQRTLRMVRDIEGEMEKDIRSLTWMSPATKEQALVKLHGVANKIGYPERWRDYSSVHIMRNDLLADYRNAQAFEVHRRLAKIGEPVDKLEWTMTPPTVNAYYSPSMNNINFPAGILQPPFYYKTGDEAVNFGAIGAVVGHELTHGFDDEGRQYDATGNLRDWWTPEDAQAFKERANCIADEYGNFVSVGDVKLNGRLTLGENAADNGGVRLAYMALLDSLMKHALPNVDGYTPEQRFFLGYGQIWCQNITDEAARMRAVTDPHSTGRFRVDGVVQNMPEFQKAFSCEAGQPMVSASACRVW